MTEITTEAVSAEATAAETTSTPEAVSEEATTEIGTEDVVTEQVIADEAVKEEVKVDTAEASDFSELLSEEFKDIKALKDFKSVDDLAKSYMHLNSMLGKRFEDLSQEELGSYYAKLGRPSEASEYTFADEINEDGAHWARDVFFEAGLTQDQAKLVTEKYHELEQAKLAEMEVASAAEADQNMNVLKAEFGEAFEERVNLAKRAVNELGGDELKTLLNETGLGNNAQVVKLFAKIGKEILEDRILESDKEARFGVTPEEAQKQIMTLKSNPEFMDQYLGRNGYSKTSDAHKHAVAKMEQLFNKAYKA